MLLKNLVFLTSLLLASIGIVNAMPTVMVAGDSISAGFMRPSYRLPLLNSLRDYGCQVDMVGDQIQNGFEFRQPISSSNGFFFDEFGEEDGFDLNHEAFSGIRADQYADGVVGANSTFYTVLPVAQYVLNEQPDYMLLLLGTNDLGAELVSSNQLLTDADINRWADTTLQDVRRVIDRSITGFNNVSTRRVLVANFLPYARTIRTAAELVRAKRASDLFSERLESMVLAMGDPRVLLVDVYTGFDADSMTFDGIHPNALGERFLADAFLPVLRGAGLCPEAPAITSPSTGSTINGDTVNLQWNSNGTAVSEWRVRVGDSQSGSSSTYFDSGRLPADTTNITVSGLPADLTNVFVSLQYTSGDSVDFVLSNFISRSGSPTGAGEPDMVSPSGGSVLPGAAVNFSWKSNDYDIIDWYVRIGSTPPQSAAANGSTDYFDSGLITDESTRGVSVSGLPTDGSTVYVQLGSKTRAGPWILNNLTYTATGADFPTKALDSGEWYQVGLPYDPGSRNRVRQVFDALPAEELVIDDDGLAASGILGTWVLYEYQLADPGQGQDNYRRLGADDPVEVGKGYWILQVTGSPVTLSAPQGASANISNVSDSQAAACANPGRCYAVAVDIAVDSDKSERYSMLSAPMAKSSQPSDFRVSTSNDTGCSGGRNCSLTEAFQNNLLFETLFVWRPELADYERVGPATGVMRPWDGFWAASISGADGQNAELIMSEPAPGT